jgi:hypothetical protein
MAGSHFSRWSAHIIMLQQGSMNKRAKTTFGRLLVSGADATNSGAVARTEALGAEDLKSRVLALNDRLGGSCSAPGRGRAARDRHGFPGQDVRSDPALAHAA